MEFINFQEKPLELAPKVLSLSNILELNDVVVDYKEGMYGGYTFTKEERDKYLTKGSKNPAITFCLKVTDLEEFKKYVPIIKMIQEHAPILESFDGTRDRLTCSTLIRTNLPKDDWPFSGYGLDNLFVLEDLDGGFPVISTFQVNLLSPLADPEAICKNIVGMCMHDVTEMESDYFNIYVRARPDSLEKVKFQKRVDH